MQLSWLALLVSGAVAVVGCDGPVTTTTTHLDEVTIHPAATPLPPHTTCSVTTYREEASSRDHLEACSDLELISVPPAAGPHYGQWADFRTYDAPVPWGYLLHSLEHGAVVLAHACEGDCPEVRAELEAIAADREDALCRDGPTARIIVVPAPDLDVPIAAIAWGHVYLATCLDPPSLRAFVDAHYGNAPEDLCVPGVDLSAAGWCP
jgi:hypothetical protein